MSLSTLDRVEVDVTTNDPAAHAHYVRRPLDKESAGAWVTEATFLGIEVEALCGYRWIPTRDPQKLPVCKKCADIAANAILGID